MNTEAFTETHCDDGHMRVEESVKIIHPMTGAALRHELGPKHFTHGVEDATHAAAAFERDHITRFAACLLRPYRDVAMSSGGGLAITIIPRCLLSVVLNMYHGTSAAG